MSKVMVTGALGNVGSYVVKYLLENNQEVVCADIDLEKLSQKYAKQTKNVYFDFTKSDTFAKALKDVDRVFIMRPPHIGKPEDLKPFIEALKNKGDIKLVSFLSLIGVEKNPIPPHHNIEKYIEQANLPFAHIRPSFFMQNISGIHAFEIKEFNQLVVPVAKALTSFIDAQDIGEITANILTNYQDYQNQAFDITGPDAIDYYQAASILSKVLERKITYQNLKPRLVKKYWLEIRGLDKEYTNVMSMLYLMTRFGGAKKVTNTFEKIMGKKAQSFEQFVIKNKEAWL